MRIVEGSAGSFLCPPGHPNHFHHIEAGRRDDPDLFAGLDYALRPDSDDVPESIRARVQKMFDDAQLVCSEDWVRSIYAYFRNCYSPDGKDRNTSRALIVGQPWYVDKGSRYDTLNRSDEALAADDPRVIPTHHLAYLMVRSYFPDHEPRLDLIETPPAWGQKPCIKCGTNLQYEAAVDGWAIPITDVRDCPQGGLHEVTP